MTLNKGEVKNACKRKQYIALYGELVLKRLCTCRKTDYFMYVCKNE